MTKHMNKIRVKCIKCGTEWEKDSVISWGPNDFTSSLCDHCFKEVIAHTIHRKQLSEGNFDCFGKAKVYCDQFECKYRKWCLFKGDAGKSTRE
jgi:hypothetical protein